VNHRPSHCSPAQRCSTLPASAPRAGPTLFTPGPRRLGDELEGVAAVGVLEAAVRRWPGRAPSGLCRRTAQPAAAGVALVVTAGCWVAIVELVPAADRPYASGSQTNSVLELILGYNGFGRLTGNEPGSIGGLPGSDGRAVGGGQIARLFPAALPHAGHQSPKRRWLGCPVLHTRRLRMALERRQQGQRGRGADIGEVAVGFL